MQNVEEIINHWAESLSERLVEIRFIDIDEMKASMKVHLKSALFDCLKIQISQTEKKLIEAKKRFTQSFGSPNNHIQNEIISLKAKTKEQQKLMSALERSERIKQQNKWMLEKHPESFKEFCKYFEENFEFKLPKQ